MSKSDIETIIQKRATRHGTSVDALLANDRRALRSLKIGWEDLDKIRVKSDAPQSVRPSVVRRILRKIGL